MEIVLQLLMLNGTYAGYAAQGQLPVEGAQHYQK
jgi:hypothetical protein